MFRRQMTAELKEIAQSYPVVTVVGPGQSGKTTLVKNTFPEKPYVNLEAPEVQGLATDDPKAFLGKYPDGAILDEIQQAPLLLSYIQLIVDEEELAGRQS